MKATNYIIGIKNRITTHIRKDKKLLNYLKNKFNYENKWKQEDSHVNITEKEKIKNSILVIANKDSMNWRNFKNAETLFDNILIVDNLSLDLSSYLNYDAIIVCIEHNSSIERARYQEKLMALYSCHKNVHPRLLEGYIYENKRALLDLLLINKIPIPKTIIYESKQCFQKSMELIQLPIIAKSSLGSGAKGVKIIYTKKELEKYSNICFGSGYNRPLADYRDKEWGYLILQEYIENIREYRVIKIGESWFAHEKIAGENGLHSGSGNAAWIIPEDKLLNFCFNIAKKLNISTAAFDIFQTPKKEYLVNEIQYWFGSFNDSQMYIDGKPGRYKKIGDNWEFEEGYFNIFGGVYLRAQEISKEIL